MGTKESPKVHLADSKEGIGSAFRGRSAARPQDFYGYIIDNKGRKFTIRCTCRACVRRA